MLASCHLLQLLILCCLIPKSLSAFISLSSLSSFTSLPPDSLTKRKVTQFANNWAALDYPLWLVELGIGTPPQQVRVELDTGSSDLWVPSVNAAGDAECGTFGCFDPSKSLSLKSTDKSFNFSYDQGQYSAGTFVTEDVVLTASGVKMQGVTIGVSTETKYESNGVFGVGPRLGEEVGSTNFKVFSLYDNFVFKLKSSGIISKAVFSLYRTYTQKSNDTAAASGNATDGNDVKSISSYGKGKVLFGGTDSSKYEGTLNSFDIIPVPSFQSVLKYIPFIKYFPGMKKYFLSHNLINLYSVQWDGTTIYTKGNGLATLVDTGAFINVVPDAIFQTVVEKTGAKELTDSDDLNTAGWYYLDCDAGFNYTFAFTFANSKRYELKLSDSLIPFLELVSAKYVDGKKQCFLPFVPGDDNLAYLGISTLKNLYVLYDYENYKIGLAKGVSSGKIHV